MSIASIRRPVVAGLAALVLSGCAASTTTAQTPTANPTTAAIDTVVTRLMQLGVSPGLGVVVVRDTQIVYMKGFGFADVEKKQPFTPKTVFYIASTTKSFTGLAAALLDHQGKFSIDAPLSRYLPSLKLHEPLNPDSITIRSLLTHTHGIGNSGPVVVRLAYTGQYAGNDELARLLLHHQPAQSGRVFRYGNIGYNVATLAMDAHLRQPWQRTLEDVLFKPLGMTSTTAYISRVPAERIAAPYRLTPDGFVRRPQGKVDATMQSAGGLVTTLEDMGKWLEVHINDGRLNGKQVFPENVVRHAHEILARTEQQSGERPQNIGYGLGWNIMVNGKDTVLVHGGGFPGYTTIMSFSPGKRTGVAIFANNAELGGAAEFIAGAIYSILDGRVDAPPIEVLQGRIEQAKQGIANDFKRRAARPQTLPYPFEAYAGVYEHPTYGRLELSVVNGKLEARMGQAWSAIEVFDPTKNQLRIEIFGNGEVMTVEMKDGRAESILWSGRTFVRVS